MTCPNCDDRSLLRRVAREPYRLLSVEMPSGRVHAWSVPKSLRDAIEAERARRGDGGP